jgi:hypothetical protein
MAGEDKMLNVVVKYSTTGVDAVKASASQIDDALDKNKETMKAYQSQVEEFTTSAMSQMGSGKIPFLPSDAPPMGTQEYNDWAKKINDMAAANDALDKSQQDAAQSTKDEKEQIDSAAQSAGTYSQSIRGLSSEFTGLRYAARGLTNLGALLTVGGGLLTGSLVADAKEYIKTVGQTTALSAEWLATEERIKQDNIAIGEVAARVILPSMKLGADILDRVARIAEQNPWLVQAALGVGTAMAVVGGAMLVVSRIVMVISEFGLALTRLGLLQAQQMAMNAGGGVGGAEYLPGRAGSAAASQAMNTPVNWGQVTLVASAVFLGAEAGVAVANALEKLINPADAQKYGSFNMGDAIGSQFQIMLGLGRQFAALLGNSLPQTRDFFLSIAKANAAVAEWVAALTGANFTLNKLKDQWGDFTGSQSALDSNTTQEVQAFIQFQKQMQQAEQNYGSQRVDIVRQFEQQMKDATAQYESQRAEIIRSAGSQIASITANYTQQEADAQRNYQDQVSKSERDFRVSEEEAARQHALELQKLAEEHNRKIQDLAASRDALGIVHENQSYRDQVNQSNQQYNEQRRQAALQHALQLADLRRSYEEQRTTALEQYQKQLSDAKAQEAEKLSQLDANHKAEMEKLQAQEKDKLQKLDDGYKASISQLQTSFIDQINAMTQSIVGNTQAWVDYMKTEAQDFKTWLDNYRSQNGLNASSNQNGTGGSNQNGQNNAPFSPTAYSNKSQPNLSSAMSGKQSAASSSGSVTHITISSKSLTMSEMRHEIRSAFGDMLAEVIPALSS